MAVDMVPRVMTESTGISVEFKLTIYSLFKQINEGDVNSNKMAFEKYYAWSQQKGKSALKCKQEYVLLVCQHDKSLKNTLEQVLNGTLTEIKYKSKGGINDSPGGALQKSVPKPKNVHAEENKLFVAGLNNREL